MRRLAMVMVAAATVLLVGACSSTNGATAGDTTISSARALQFSGKTVDGVDFSGHSLFGKPAVLWFWAPWCPTCQAEAPSVAKAAQTHPSVGALTKA
jgi:thiol-disulfide isomerase/thioredoxin